MHAADPARGRDKLQVAGWLVLGLLLVTVALALWARGSSFYRLALHERFDHPEYRMLSPSGPLGHAYGFIATALVLANLSYLLRRKFARLRVGSMRLWLNLHVATGLLSGLFGLSHSALQLRNPIATVTMAALAVTLATGIVGRFIYFFVPRPNLARIEENCRTFEAISPGLGRELSERLRGLPMPEVIGRVTLPKVLWLLPTWERDARRRKRLVRDTLNAHEPWHRDEFRMLRGCIAETAGLAGAVPRAVAYDHLMRSWRGLHRFFALLMIATMLVHVGVAWYYGYRWIFSHSGPGP
jgi:hypothetical protein